MNVARLESAVYPQFFPAHWLTETCDIVHSQFPSRIRIGYVVRGDGSYSYLMGQEFKESGLSLRALHDAALHNLRALPMPSMSVAATPGGPEAYLGKVEDNFTAARILLPVVQRELRKELGDDFHVALPCRDWMVCWSRDQSRAFQERNASDALKTFLSDDYNLTPDVLVFAESGFRLHMTQHVGA